MYFNQDVANPWSFAVTETFSEVVSAYEDGESLKRFKTVKIQPVELDDVYAFRIQGNKLVDVSKETRDKLTKMKYK